jgi:hypothetical protein
VPVLDRQSARTRVLSNWHVFCDDLDWKELDRRITQPAVDLGGKPATDTIGSVVNAKVGEIERSFAYNWYVDCAISDASGRKANPSIVGIGRLKGWREPNLDDVVRKYGATTYFTVGTVASTNMTTVVDYPFGPVNFFYHYRIVPSPPYVDFSLPGDSGSVVVDADDNAVGLLFAGSEEAHQTVANPMYMVLGALDIKLDT